MSQPFSPTPSEPTSAPSRDERARDALGGLGLVAEELGRAETLAQREPHRLGRRLARARPGLARLGALALHRRGEAVGVDAHAARAQRVLRQVERKAVGVVELERDLAGELARRRQASRVSSSRIARPRASVARKRVSSSFSVSVISASARSSSG